MLLGIGEKFADPNDLLEALLFADLNDDLLGARKLVGREAVAPVYKQRDIVVPGSERRGRNLVDRSPRKAKRSGLAKCSGGKIQQTSNGEW